MRTLRKLSYRFQCLFFVTSLCLLNFCAIVVSNPQANKASPVLVGASSSIVENFLGVQWITHLGTSTRDNFNGLNPNGEINSVSATESCNSIAKDADGNIFCVGNTAGSLNDTYGGGINDAYVMKLNSSGVVQWITQLGTQTKDNLNMLDPNGEVDEVSANENCLSASVDSSGNVYCAGFTTGSLNDTNGSGGSDAFIMKLNSNGVIEWITHLGTQTRDNINGKNPNNVITSVGSSEICYAVSVDSDSNVYCAGSTNGSLNDSNGGSQDIFVMKLNSSGVIQWITQLGTNTKNNSNLKDPNSEVDDVFGADYCASISVDSNSNVYCAGYTQSGLNDTYGGSTDAFVLKLNSSGVVQWITQLGQQSRDNTNGRNPNGEVDSVNASEYCYSVAVDTDSNIYCGGYTTGNLNDTNGSSSADIFIMKLNSSGVIQWITQLGQQTRDNSNGRDPNDEVNAVDLPDFCNSIGVDANFNVYCGGSTLSDLNDSSGTTYDAMLLKLNSLGVVERLVHLGASTRDNSNEYNPNNQINSVAGNDQCVSIVVDSSGSIYCGGYTYGNLNDTNGGSGDIFLMKLY